ncbi:glutathione-dependent formaldehyde-activating enzyme [Coniochaeta sp. 2T2.1]|nr:glutathione-dependent formaldehyde-activating enzyme [Coniochaeta sp. 2T2.1]
MNYGRLDISCLCGSANQQVNILGDNNHQRLGASWEASSRLCHCHACRHLTGLLCTSFLPISEPEKASLDGLTAYASAPHSTSYFCPKCGCHVFACSKRSVTPRGLKESIEGTEQWAVATGTIAGSPDNGSGSSKMSDGSPSGWRWYWTHDKVDDTQDGGISVWINSALKSAPVTHIQSIGAADSTILPASCHCGTVRFHITRPDESSRMPKSPFPDLMLPYCRTDASILKNPSDVKWWLRGKDKTKYLAGTCACRSCRLSSGFDIQTWAFVSRSNIRIYSTSPTSEEEDEPRLLDFGTIPSGVLKSYESSPGVAREFCPRCGATVFWHNKERAELIDVSVGLLEAPEGARAESWLEWWTERVSFAEEAGAEVGRQQVAFTRARRLIENLEQGLGGQHSA